MSCGVRNSPGPAPYFPNDLMNRPSLVKREMRATVPGTRLVPAPERPSAMRKSPFGGSTMLVGSHYRLLGDDGRERPVWSKLEERLVRPVLALSVSSCQGPLAAGRSVLAQRKQPDR